MLIATVFFLDCDPLPAVISAFPLLMQETCERCKGDQGVGRVEGKGTGDQEAGARISLHQITKETQSLALVCLVFAIAAAVTVLLLMSQ